MPINMYMIKLLKLFYYNPLYKYNHEDEYKYIL